MNDSKHFRIQNSVLKGYGGPGGDVTIPNSVTSIGFGAFNDCTSLTSITIPNSVTTIGDWAFSGCERLTSITIPDSVTTIGDRAFLGCERLTSIVVAENNPVYHSSANCLIETKSKTLIAGCSTSVIPADGSITSIGDDAFRYCTSLTSVTIPNSVTTIGDRAFSGCKRLKSVAFGENSQLTSIAKDLFSDCESLTSITCSSTLAKELNRFLPSKPIILHIADLSNVSAKFRPAAAVGFAEDDRDCTDENGKKYLKYIKANAAKLAKEAVKHPALLYLMLREKLIAAKDLEAVTATVQESGNAELIAAMLEYGNSAVSEKEKAKVQQKKEERETNVTNFIFDATKVEKLNGKTFAVTGKLKTFASRDELKECLTACGATLTETLQQGVNYLITNTPDSGSAKNQQAMKLNIRRITEAQFNKMIGRTVAQSGRGETF